MARGKQKPPIAVVRQNAVLRYFSGNKEAMQIALNKPYELYAEENTDVIIEIIEGEMKRGLYD